MELKLDCIRSVMLEIEKKQKYYLDDLDNVTKDCLSLTSLCESLPKFSKEDIYYSLFNLDQAGYINLSTQWAGGSIYMCHVNYMTYSGHEFLNEIRDSKRWEIVKKGLSAAKNFSLDMVTALSKGMTKAFIEEYVRSVGL